MFYYEIFTNITDILKKSADWMNECTFLLNKMA